MNMMSNIPAIQSISKRGKRFGILGNCNVRAASQYRIQNARALAGLKMGRMPSHILLAIKDARLGG